MTRRAPIRIDEGDLPEAQATPADAPPPADDAPRPDGAAMRRMTRLAAAGPNWRVRAILGGLVGFLGIAAGLAAYDFVMALLTRFPALGWLAAGLGLVGLAGLLAWAGAELRSYMRLARLDGLRRTVAAGAGGSAAEARAAVDALRSFYAHRPELAWGRADLETRLPDLLDGQDMLAAAERALMAPLDAAAEAEVVRAARTVAAATALVPMALVDLVVALTANLTMIRRIAAIYGGRAGSFGSVRLLRGVAQHLLATGLVAVGDDLVGSVAGGGALSRVSRRFGEGVVNGALTARVGIAAIEVCRPMPFAARPRPRLRVLLGRGVTGLFSG